ncbi:MAG: NAD(P)-binding domain-containing protein, partial [Bdellovibrionales bacterium]|nr:NAD(P)-binding domain-containing protein [Bdellovibrionales bacterium]
MQNELAADVTLLLLGSLGETIFSHESLSLSLYSMTEHFEVAIIGAGPAGLGASTNAAHHNLSHVLIEKAEIGNTIFEYQLRKHVMAEPQKLPLRAHVSFQAGTREEILDAWNKAIQEKKVNVWKKELTKIEKEGDRFKISCGGDSCTANVVILCIGVQGSPRKLGVEGQDLPHVSYTLRDPDAFVDKDILVVGAGDAAIENAIALAEKNRVSIINRGGEFARAKEANNALMVKAIESGKITCYYDSGIARVEQEFTYIETPSGEVKVRADQINARIGAILPRKFLEDCGIGFPSDDRNAVPTVDQHYQSTVKNLYVLGALIGYPLIKHAINQGYEVVEHILGNDIEPADQVLVSEKLGHLPGEVNANLEMIR